MQSLAPPHIYIEEHVFMDNNRLIEDCKAGDRNALGLLYKTYLPAMREIVAYYVHNQDIVPDILHDGFILAFTSIDSLKDNTKVEAWLTTIMKNLSLQYLKSEANHISVPISEAAVSYRIDETFQDNHILTFEELNNLIENLPDGYGKVFRLAVLDGLSHKEIGALLGIAPHSSSSQLSHAKAMLRRMILKYRKELGILSIISILLMLWHGIFKQRDDKRATVDIGKNTGEQILSESEPKTKAKKPSDSVSSNEAIINVSVTGPELTLIAEAAPLPDNHLPYVENDSVPYDSIIISPGLPDLDEFIVMKEIPEIISTDTPEWSLSLSYSGSLGQTNSNLHRIPDPNLPDSERPTDPSEIEVMEKSRHYMPLVISLYVNKSLTPHWSVETGLRYTFLRSDLLSESKLLNKETIQSIHYLGIPLKVNYLIFTSNGLSVYGQCGGGLDIPVHATQHVTENHPDNGSTDNSTVMFHAPIQWSVGGGVGLQYSVTPSFSIYAEPSFQYFFKPESDIKTIRQEKPFEINIPIGLRWSW